MTSYQFDELLSLYKKYRMKKFFYSISKIFFVSIIFFITFIIYQDKNKIKKDYKKYINFFQKDNTKPLNNKNNLNKPKKKDNNIIRKKFVAKKNIKQNKNHLNFKKKIAKNSKRKTKKSFTIKIKKRKSLKALLVNEKNKRTYASAIALANYFLERKKYAKAVKWSIKASKREPSRSFSWILYARAKVRLGEKEKAKRALKIYLKNNDSKEAQNLLDTL